MAIAEKAYELRQKKDNLLAETREMVEKAEKENRGLTAEEKTVFEAKHAEARGYAERASSIERQEAGERIGYDDPEKRKSAPLPHEDPANTKHGKHRYSILKAIAEVANGKKNDGRVTNGGKGLSGLELETSQEIAKRNDKEPINDFFVPLGSHTRPAKRSGKGPRGIERRALDVANSGGNSVPTILDKEYIELLRNRIMVMQAGAREIKDLQGKFAIPRQNAAATGQWVGESAAPNGSNQTLDQVVFQPKTIGAFTDISRRFFHMSNIDGEEFVMEDLFAIIARGIDLAALNGAGSSTVPLGILQNTAITTGNTVSLGTNGAAPTYAAMVAMETLVARGNADIGDLAYLTNADGRGTLKTTAKIGSTFPVFLWENDEINGHAAYATQQLPRNLVKGSSGSTLSPLIFGNWSDLIIAYWSGLDILVDPYTGSSAGTVRVVGLQDCDVQVRHPESFAVITDMVTNQG